MSTESLGPIHPKLTHPKILFTCAWTGNSHSQLQFRDKLPLPTNSLSRFGNQFQNGYDSLRNISAREVVQQSSTHSIKQAGKTSWRLIQSRLYELHTKNRQEIRVIVSVATFVIAKVVSVVLVWQASDC